MVQKRDVSIVVRVPSELRDAANKRADEKEETLSDAIRKFLRRYVK